MILWAAGTATALMPLWSRSTRKPLPGESLKIVMRGADKEDKAVA